MNSCNRMLAIVGILVGTAATEQRVVLVEVNGNRKFGYGISGAAVLIDGKPIPSDTQVDSPSSHGCSDFRSENVRAAESELWKTRKYYLYSLGILVGTARLHNARETEPNAKVFLFPKYRKLRFPVVGSSRSDLGHTFNPERFVTDQDKNDLLKATLNIIARKGHASAEIVKQQFWKRKFKPHGPNILMAYVQAKDSSDCCLTAFILAVRDKNGNLSIEYSDPYPSFSQVDQLDVDKDGTDELVLRGDNSVRFLRRTNGDWKELFNYSFMVVCS